MLPLIIVILGLILAALPLSLAGIIVSGCIVVVLALLHPKITVYLLIPLIPFSSLFQVTIGGANLSPIEALLGLMLLTWLLQMATRQEIVIPHPPLLWPFLIFLSTILLSWLATLSLKASLVETVKWVEMLLLYLFLWANFSAKDRSGLIALLLLAGAAEGLLGLYQFVFKVGPEGFLLFDGRFLRAYGTFRQPNPYAGYLGLVLPLALALTLWAGNLLAKANSAKDRLKAAGMLAGSGTAMGIMLAGLFASQSRGAWLGFIGAVILTLLLKGGRWAAALTTMLISVAILVSLGGLTFLPTTIVNRFLDALPFLGNPDIAGVQVTSANFAILERLAHWQAAQGMWRDSFWLGVGFGNYEVVYPAYAIGEWLDPLGHAHNYILNLGAETGFVGLLGYTIFWIWVISLGIRNITQTPSSSLDRAVLAGCLGIFAHLHTHNFLDNLYVQGMYLHVVLIMGLITLTRPKYRRDNRPGYSPPFPSD